MSRLQRHDMEELSGHVTMKLLEVAEVAFAFTGRNRHSFNRMFLVMREGKAESCILNHSSASGQQKLAMKAGHVYFMPCELDLEFQFQPDMRFVSLHFKLEMFESFDVFSHYTECASTYAPQSLRQIFRVIHRSRDIRGICLLQGFVFQLASGFILESVSTVNFSRMAEKYQTLFRYISEQGDARTTVGELARRLGKERDALSREFSRDCGVPLKKFLLRGTLHRAERLLVEPGMSIKEVAKRLNFSNEFYFSRFFKTNTGTSPRDYRQNFRYHVNKQES